MMHFQSQIKLVVAAFVCLLLVACNGSKRLSKDAYLNGFEDGTAFTNVIKADEGQMKIYLIRHAKPAVVKRKLCTSSMAQAYVDAYARAPIITFDSSLVTFDLDDNQVIYCSSLRRAQETADAIFGEQFEVISDARFREFETRIIGPSDTYTLPLIIWQSLSRAAWVLGLNQYKIESYKDAKARAQQVALQLSLNAKHEQTVVLVAHGMLNRSVAKRLQKNGWRLLQKQGHVNIGATVLMKEIGDGFQGL